MKSTPTKNFHDLLCEFETAVLVTHADGRLRARPMAVAQVEDNCDLWFITAEATAKVDEIESDERIHVVCQNGWRSCISISGRASLVRDRAKIREVWKTSYRAWFPQGSEDSNIVLIRVQGEQGEYWDHTGLKALSHAYQSAKAIVTGGRPDVKEGEQHGRVNLTTNR